MCLQMVALTILCKYALCSRCRNANCLLLFRMNSPSFLFFRFLYFLFVHKTKVTNRRRPTQAHIVIDTDTRIDTDTLVQRYNHTQTPMFIDIVDIAVGVSAIDTRV